MIAKTAVGPCRMVMSKILLKLPVHHFARHPALRAAARNPNMRQKLNGASTGGIEVKEAHCPF
jgi:hypothetical protein